MRLTRGGAAAPLGLHEDLDPEGLVQLNRAALIIRAVEHERGGAAPQSWSVPDSGALWPYAEWIGFRHSCRVCRAGSRGSMNPDEIAVATKCLPSELATGRSNSPSREPRTFSQGPPCRTARVTPYAIHMDGIWMAVMASNIRELRPKATESEKITLNLGFVDLGHIDLLVQERFYSNRTDFIRAAIRNQLDRHNDVVKQVVARHQLDLGLRSYSRQDLQAVRVAGETLHIQVLGLVVIAPDVSPSLARDTIASIHVLGALQASPGVKAALTDRMR